MKGVYLRIILSGLSLCIFQGYVSGQMVTERNLTIAFGAGNLHLLNDHASPLIFSGTGIAPSIQYSVRRTKSRQYAEGSFNHYRLKTDQDNFNVRDYSGRVRYAWLYTPFHLKLSEHDMNISFGGSLTFTYPCTLTTFPEGGSPEGKGIIPDILVENTKQEVDSGKDNALEYALEFLVK